MFAKLPADKLKKKASLKNQLLAKLREKAEECMPPIVQIIDEIFPKKIPVTVYNLENHVKMYAVEDRPKLIELGSGEVFPVLKIAIENPGLLPCVYVDDGAVKALLRGADLMAPGIKQIPGPFQVNQIVEIRLLEQKEPFAIGLTTVSSEELTQGKSGIAIRILHVLRDGLYLAQNGI